MNQITYKEERHMQAISNIVDAIRQCTYCKYATETLRIPVKSAIIQRMNTTAVTLLIIHLFQFKFNNVIFAFNNVQIFKQ